MKSLHQKFKKESARLFTKKPEIQKQDSPEKLDEAQLANIEFLKEFSFVNNAKKVTLLYKDDDDNCENELIKFEEDERRFVQIYNELK